MGLFHDTLPTSKITEGRIPKVGRTSTCHGCGAEIVWIKTTGGKSMPCDASPVYYKMSEGGKKLVTPNGAVVSCEIITDPNKADGFGFVPHWATCPKAEGFRKKATNENGHTKK